MRRRLASLVALVACGCGGASDPASRYFDDAGFRRATLTASLVNPSDGYAQLRLAHYASGAAGDWDALPSWNPLVATLDADGQRQADERALDLSHATDAAGQLALGETAFHRYPMQLWSRPSQAASFVSVRFADGTLANALTCSSCHERVVDGASVSGLANEAIDLGWGPGASTSRCRPRSRWRFPTCASSRWRRTGSATAPCATTGSSRSPCASRR